MPPSRETHTRKSFRLITLGGAALVAPDGTPVAEQRRRVALLALVAAGGDRGTSRDKLIATLSPDSSTESARHALHQLLYYLRRQVGEEVFLGTAPLRLNPQLVSFDVAEFEGAVARGALAEAAALYRGPFLDGFHLGESAEFEEWASLERLRLAAKHADVLVRLAEDAEGRGDHRTAAEWWRTLAGLDRLNAQPAIGLMRALAASGDRRGALQHGQAFQSLVQQELETEPDAAVAALMIELRSQHAVAADASPAAQASPPVPMHATTPAQELTPLLAAPFTPTASAVRDESRGRKTVAPRRRVHAWMAIGVGAIAAVVSLMAMRREAPASEAPSLAVVPIVNRAGDSLDYLADGIVRAAMDRLSSARSLRVITARDVHPPGAPATDVAALGSRVGVTAILSGTLERERDTVWLRVELRRSRDGARLAGGRFDVETTRLVAIESDLLDTVAVALGLARMRRDTARPRDAEATALLMRAEHYFGKRDRTSFRRAFELYLQAIEHDAASAEAYAGLATTYGAFGFYGVMPIPVAFERGRAAANRALQLDPGSARAIAHLAHEQGVRFWRWDEAERGLRDAIRLEPWQAASWMLLGTQMRVRGRFDEALVAYRKARDLDPLARHYTYQIAHAFQCAGEPDSALAAYRDAMTLGTSYPAAHHAAAGILVSVGRYDEALDEWRIAAKESGDTARVRALTGARGKAGFERFWLQLARKELSAREALPAGAVVSPTEFSALYAILGDTARAFEWLDRARDIRDPNLPMIGCHSEYDFMRDTPRFRALLKQMHLDSATFGRRPRVGNSVARVASR